MMSRVAVNSNQIGVFIGNALAFSDIIIRHTAAEFDFISFQVFPTIDDLLNLPLAQAQLCRIILVDEAHANELRQNLPLLLARSADARVALSYRRPAIAQSFLRQAAGDHLLSKVGMLPMRLEIDHWMSILRLLICGERYIPFELFNSTAPAEPEPVVVEKPRRPSSTSRLAQLTEREAQVLRSVSEGKQNKIIAAELDLSEHTVKLHIHNVISKLGVNNRTEAAVWFLADKPGTNGSRA